MHLNGSLCWLCLSRTTSPSSLVRLLISRRMGLRLAGVSSFIVWRRWWSLTLMMIGTLYWLVYRHHNQISVVIEPQASLIHARLRASLDGLDQGNLLKATNLIVSGEYRRR